MLALERYLAVSKPIEYHNATLGINPWRRVMNYIVPVIVFSIIFNVSKFFEAKVDEYPDNPEGTNCWYVHSGMNFVNSNLRIHNFLITKITYLNTNS